MIEMCVALSGVEARILRTLHQPVPRTQLLQITLTVLGQVSEENNMAHGAELGVCEEVQVTTCQVRYPMSIHRLTPGEY